MRKTLERIESRFGFFLNEMNYNEKFPYIRSIGWIRIGTRGASNEVIRRNE